MRITMTISVGIRCDHTAGFSQDIFVSVNMKSRLQIPATGGLLDQELASIAHNSFNIVFER